MSCKTAQEGDVGTTFRATIIDGVDVLDISGATTRELYFKPPVGAAKTFSASFTTDGTDGQMEYVTAAASDLDETGTWQWQAHVQYVGGNTWKSDIRTFTVEANLV